MLWSSRWRRLSVAVHRSSQWCAVVVRRRGSSTFRRTRWHQWRDRNIAVPQHINIYIYIYMVYILQSLNQTQEKFDDLPNLQMVMCLVILNNERYLEITWVCLKLGDVPILGNQIMEKAMVIHQWIWRLPIFKQTWIGNIELGYQKWSGGYSWVNRYQPKLGCMAWCKPCPSVNEPSQNLIWEIRQKCRACSCWEANMGFCTYVDLLHG